MGKNIIWNLGFSVIERFFKYTGFHLIKQSFGNSDELVNYSEVWKRHETFNHWTIVLLEMQTYNVTTSVPRMLLWKSFLSLFAAGFSLQLVIEPMCFVICCNFDSLLVGADSWAHTIWAIAHLWYLTTILAGFMVFCHPPYSFTTGRLFTSVFLQLDMCPAFSFTCQVSSLVETALRTF